MVTATILAGGQSRRMNYQDKGLLPLNQRALCQHVIDRIAPQVSAIQINANQHLDQYQQWRYPVIPDQLTGFQGPLAGVHAGLLASNSTWNLMVSCDTPYLPLDLVARFQQISRGEKAVYASVGSRAHPIIMLIPRYVASELAHFLETGQRKPIDFLIHCLHAEAVDFSDQPEAFMNLNRPEELIAQEQKPLCTERR